MARRKRVKVEGVKQYMFAELNQKYIEHFSLLQSAQSVLPKRQYEQMAEALMDSYKRELSIIVGYYSLQKGRELFELKQKLSTYVPWKFLCFKNKVAKAIIKECKAEFEAYLASLQQQDMEEAPLEPEEEITAVVPVCTEVVAAEQ